MESWIKAQFEESSQDLKNEIREQHIATVTDLKMFVEINIKRRRFQKMKSRNCKANLHQQVLFQTSGQGERQPSECQDG
ncbi:Hypothetical predicted protein, partial [Mytilus galloprovincialis]